MTRRLIAAAGALALLVGCATYAEAEPAVLDDAGSENVRALTETLAGAMGVARVTLGAADLTTATVIPVLPPAPSTYDTKSLATPTLFDLEIDAGRCFARRRDTGERFALDNVRCRPAG